MRIGVLAGVSILAPLLALLGAVAVILGFKGRRRRQRRTADQSGASIAGAWAELRDRFIEAGVDTTESLSLAEAAETWTAALPDATPRLSAQVSALADQVSESQFHPQPPTPEAAAVAWDHYEEVAAVLGESTTTVERIKRKVDPRPLLEHHRRRS